MEEPGNGGDLEQDFFEEQQEQDVDLLEQSYDEDEELLLEGRQLVDRLRLECVCSELP